MSTLIPPKRRLKRKQLSAQNVVREIAKATDPNKSKLTSLDIHKLGIKLKVPQNELAKIEEEPRTTKQHLREVLEYFIQHHPSPSWGRLSKAFRELHLKNISKQLEKYREPTIRTEEESSTCSSDSEDEEVGSRSKGWRGQWEWRDMTVYTVTVGVVLIAIVVYVMFLKKV